jgi:hypothetical protein
MTIKLNEHERAVIEEEYNRFLMFVQCIARCHGLKTVTLNPDRTEFIAPDPELPTSNIPTSNIPAAKPFDLLAKSMAAASPPQTGPSDKEIFG